MTVRKAIIRRQYADDALFVNLEDPSEARGAAVLAIDRAEAVQVDRVMVDDAICDVGVVLAEDKPQLSG